MPVNGASGDTARELESRARRTAQNVAANKRMSQLSSRVNARAAEQTLPLKTTWNRQVDPDARLILWKLKHVAFVHSHDAPGGHVGLTIRAGDCNPRFEQRLELRALQQNLEHRHVRRIVEQSVRPLRGVLIHRAARRHAKPPPANSPAVLQRRAETRLQNFENFVAHDSGLKCGVPNAS